MAFPILKYLALNPASNKLNISNATEIDRDTVHKSLKLLAKAELVYVANKKNPVVMQYAVSPRGIIALLQAHPDHVEVTKTDLAKLAEKHRSFLPLIFEKWADFPEDLAYPLLFYAVKKTADEVGFLRELSQGKQPEELERFQRNEVLHKHRIYEFMFHKAWADPWLEDDESCARWFWTVKGDDQLLKAAAAEIDRVHLRAQEDIQMLENDLRMLQLEDTRNRHELPDLQPGFKRVVLRLEGKHVREVFSWIDYEQALALDRGKRPPARSELLQQAIESGMKTVQLRIRMLRENRSPKEIDDAVKKLGREMRQRFHGQEEKQGL
jgi:hypothetical protein